MPFRTSTGEAAGPLAKWMQRMSHSDPESEARRDTTEEPSPDFADPTIQSSSPQREILEWLQDLPDAWQVIEPATHADETAIGVLFLAKALEVRGIPPGPCEARLTISGVRWKACLQANAKGRENDVRALVLRFVWENYLEHKDEFPDKRNAGDKSLRSSEKSSSRAELFNMHANPMPGPELPPLRPNSGLHYFDLPSVFQCSVELGEALAANYEAETAQKRLQRVLNPRNVGFPEAWKQEIDLADATASARQALLTIGLSLADLRGIEQFHQRGKELLSAGTWNLWDGMRLPERNVVRFLLPKAINQWGWPHNDATGEPVPFMGLKATLRDPRVLSSDWWTGDVGTLNALQDAMLQGNFLVDAITLANGKSFDIYRSNCKAAKGNKPSICAKADPKPPVQLRPAGEMLAEIESRFRSLKLVGDGETIHWVGRQSTVETTCTCDLTKDLATESDRRYPQLNKDEFAEWATEAKSHIQPEKATPNGGERIDPAANRHLVFRSLKQKFEAAAERFPEFKFFVYKADNKEGLVLPYFVDRKSRLMEERLQAGTVEAGGFWAVADNERELWHVHGSEDALREFERLAGEAGSALTPAEDRALRNILPFRVDPLIDVLMKEKWGLFVFDTLKRSGAAHIRLVEREDQRMHRLDGNKHEKPAYATYALTTSNIFAASARAIEYAGLEETTKSKTTVTSDAALTISIGSAVDHPPLRCNTLNEVKKWLEDWIAKFRDYPKTAPNYFLETEYAGGIVQKKENPRMIMARVTMANFACNQVERWLRDKGHSTALSHPADDKDLMAVERRLSNCLDFVWKLSAEAERERNESPADELVERNGTAGAESDTPLSARDLLKRWGLPDGDSILDRLEKRLASERRSNMNCFIEVQNRGRNKPKYLYHPSLVRHVLDDLKTSLNPPSEK